MNGAVVPSRDDLEAAIARVSAIKELPAGDLGRVEEARSLWQMVDSLVEARQLEGPEEPDMFDLIRAAWEIADLPAKTILAFAMLRRNDGTFVGVDVEGLEIERVDWRGVDVECPEQGVTLVRAGDGLLPVPVDPAEQVFIALLTEIELFVSSMGGGKASSESAERGFDAFELWGELEGEYRKRFIRRAAIGSGCCVLTDQRLIGVLYDEKMGGRPSSDETEAMPICAVSGDCSSTLLFSATRRGFSKCEEGPGGGTLLDGFLKKRVPSAALIGDRVDAKLQPYRVIHDRKVVKPRRNEITNAISEFCASIQDL